MIPLSRIITIVACGFILSFAPALNGQADTSLSAEKDSLKQGYKVVQGEVVRFKGDHLYVKRKNGKEVHMHIDQTTKMRDKKLEPGDLVEATVNEENQVLSIYSVERAASE